jgi:hypothetical protein
MVAYLWHKVFLLHKAPKKSAKIRKIYFGAPSLRSAPEKKYE